MLKGFGSAGAPEAAARFGARVLCVALFVCGVCGAFFFKADRSAACDRLFRSGALRSAVLLGASFFAVGRSGAGSAGILARHAAEICALRASRQRNTRSWSGMASPQNWNASFMHACRPSSVSACAGIVPFNAMTMTARAILLRTGMLPRAQMTLEHDTERRNRFSDKIMIPWHPDRVSNLTRSHRSQAAGARALGVPVRPGRCHRGRPAGGILLGLPHAVLRARRAEIRDCGGNGFSDRLPSLGRAELELFLPVHDRAR